MFQLETVTGGAVLLDLLGGPSTVVTPHQYDAAGRVPADMCYSDNDNYY